MFFIAMSVDSLKKSFNDKVKELNDAVIGTCFLVKSVTITFYGKLKKLRYCERITTH